MNHAILHQPSNYVTMMSLHTSPSEESPGNLDTVYLDEVPFFPEDFCLSSKVNHVLTGINSIYSKQTLAL